MDEAMDTALKAISAFLVTMKEEVHGILTSVGVNDSMSTLLDHVRVCWDWIFLAFERPTAAHIRAFRSAATESYGHSCKTHSLQRCHILQMFLIIGKVTMTCALNMWCCVSE